MVEVGRVLRYTGILLLAVTAVLMLAEAVGWLESRAVDPWVWTSARAGVVCLGVGLLLALLSPLGRELRRGKCVRCGVPVERGQTYCRDHLQAAVNEYRDQTRDGMLHR
jgi:hypothetical protein